MFNLQQKEPIQLKYIDLVSGFQEVLNQMINQDVKLSKEFSIMGTNLFRGIIEEYQKNRYCTPIWYFRYKFLQAYILRRQIVLKQKFV